LTILNACLSNNLLPSLDTKLTRSPGGVNIVDANAKLTIV
jgi:hypothetical protein